MARKKIEAFLFDLDGTLIDSAKDLVESANATRKHFGMEGLSYPLVVSYIGDGLPTLIRRVLPQREEKDYETAIEIFRLHYQEHCLDQTGLYPGVLQTLKFFQKKPMAVITNKIESFSRYLLKNLGIENFFPVILGGDSTPFQKPHPQPLQKALAGLKISPSQAVMVGDGTTDMESGKKAGTLTCAVTYGMRERSVLQKHNPDFWVDKFEDLKELFE